jgi:hypothetical protein
MRRVRTEHVPIPWQEAFDLAAVGLRSIRDAFGPDSVGIYVGNPTATILVLTRSVPC